MEGFEEGPLEWVRGEMGVVEVVGTRRAAGDVGRALAGIGLGGGEGGGEKAVMEVVGGVDCGGVEGGEGGGCGGVEEEGRGDLFV